MCPDRDTAITRSAAPIQPGSCQPVTPVTWTGVPGPQIAASASPAKAEPLAPPDPATTTAVAKACHRAGLVALTCGTFGNVIRFLPPLVIGEDLLDEGLSVLEDAFAAV